MNPQSHDRRPAQQPGLVILCSLLLAGTFIVTAALPTPTSVADFPPEVDPVSVLTATAEPSEPAPARTPVSSPAAVIPGGGPGVAKAAAAPAEPEPVLLPPDTIVEGVSALSYVVMDVTTGEVLFQRGGRDRRSPASLSKIMTAMIVIERADPEAIVQVDEAVQNLRGSTLMGIKPGERISVLHLLYGLMLPSGNDAAIALARFVSGTEEEFVGLMNQKAAALGLRDSRFANAHGLDMRQYGAPYSTAYDLAVLTRAALRLPMFEALARSRGWIAQGKQMAYSFGNFNQLLYWYPGTDGVKIGFTNQAGQTLVLTATREDRRLMAVVLGSKNRNLDGSRLMDLGFAIPPRPSPGP